MTTPHAATTILTAQQWDKLEQQLGFGNPAGPLWFLGMEEGVDTQYGSLEQQLLHRAEQYAGPLRDLPNVLRSGDTPGAAPRKLPATPTWKIMARLARLLVEGAADWNDRDKAHAYIRAQLGSLQGDTLLIDLLPLPAPNTAMWPVAYATRHGDRAAYRDVLLPARGQVIRALLEEHRPTWIVCYGSAYWQYYMDVFHTDGWAELQLVQAPGKRSVTLCLGRTAHGTSVLLTPFFRFDLLPERILKQLPGML